MLVIYIKNIKQTTSPNIDDKCYFNALYYYNAYVCIIVTTTQRDINSYSSLKACVVIF